MLLQTDGAEASFNDFSCLVKDIPKKRYAPVREDSDLAVKFIEGVANLAIDFREKEKSDTFRVWVVIRSISDAVTGDLKMTAHVFGEEGKSGKCRTILADIGIENSDGIAKGFKGRGVFQSLHSQRIIELSPPFWWKTGYPAVDASSMHRQGSEDCLNSDTGTINDLYRHHTRPDLLDFIQSISLNIYPWGYTVNLPDSRLEIVDAFVGPF